MVMTREEIVDKIGAIFIDQSDDDGSWNSCEITEAVMSLLTSEAAVDRFAQCDDCKTWYPHSIYGDCPYYDNHICQGCSNRNDECSCEDCSECGYYDCECPRCTKCGEVRAECECPEEESVFA